MFNIPHRSQTFTTPADAQIHLYGAQQISPAYSASDTPMNLSPTSPRNPNMLPHLPIATRQLRPPKSPMYVPAVLRPTERPPRPSPLTPPRSMHGSTDSLENSASTFASHTSTPPSHSSISDSKSDIPTSGPIKPAEPSVLPPLTLPDISGVPTRTHWKPDAHATICDAPICQKSFSLFERRHHCRHCGHVFCNTHSHYTIPLDQDAEFHPHGTESRACQHCWEQYRRWRKERASRPGSISSSSGNTTVPGTPIIGGGGGGAPGLLRGAADTGLKSPLAQSVPRDWNWSTF
ncbi:hypothetical protein MMC19_003858 [Ptychographa xylographoides]|nr:hypothetical protein [Ptychographa xylographoides]